MAAAGAAARGKDTLVTSSGLPTSTAAAAQHRGGEVGPDHHADQGEQRIRDPLAVDAGQPGEDQGEDERPSPPAEAAPRRCRARPACSAPEGHAWPGSRPGPGTATAPPTSLWARPGSAAFSRQPGRAADGGTVNRNCCSPRVVRAQGPSAAPRRSSQANAEAIASSNVRTGAQPSSARARSMSAKAPTVSPCAPRTVARGHGSPQDTLERRRRAARTVVPEPLPTLITVADRPRLSSASSSRSTAATCACATSQTWT